MFKKILFPLVALFMLAGCAKPPTTIEVSPTITLPQQDPSLMGVTVSINGADQRTDQRTDQALAKVTRDNQIVTLTASRALRFLLQEVLEKQMTARGYMVGPNGPVNLQIIVSQLYADVSQGNVRYNIATKADIAIIATAQNGNKMTKNYRASYNVEGAFQASNKNIADAVNSVLTDTIADMSQDTSIHEFIKQNAR
ncbi:lipoprotein [Escherichia coli]